VYEHKNLSGVDWQCQARVVVSNAMRLNAWWREQFKGNLRIMVIEISIVLLVALGIADVFVFGKYRLALFLLGFVAVLAIVLRLTRKDDRSGPDYPIHRIASYALVDPAIHQWCEAHSLRLYTTYKDYDVRSVDVIGKGGAKCQVWIDPPEHDAVTIHIWPYAPPHERLSAPVEDIAGALDRAYDLAARLLNARSEAGP
jgi:hypothetical protein